MLPTPPSHFFDAVRRNDAARVAQLLDSGTPVDLRDENGWDATALMYAAYGASVDVLRLLLERGADVHAREGEDPEMARRRTALHHAVLGGQPAAAALLLDAGADPNVLDSHGETPLNRALECGNAGLVRLLLENGASVRLRPRTRKYRPPLCAAAEGSRPEMLRLLLGAGAEVTAVDSLKRTPLFAAARGEGEAAEAMVRILLEAGAEVDPVDKRGDTPLLVAVIAKNVEAVDCLAAAGANLDRLFPRGTVLDMAEQDIAYLEDRFSDPAFSSPAREVAQEHQRRNMALREVLLRHGARRKGDL